MKVLLFDMHRSLMYDFTNEDSLVHKICLTPIKTPWTWNSEKYLGAGKVLSYMNLTAEYYLTRSDPQWTKGPGVFSQKKPMKKVSFWFFSQKENSSFGTKRGP